MSVNVVEFTRDHLNQFSLRYWFAPVCKDLLSDIYDGSRGYNIVVDDGGNVCKYIMMCMYFSFSKYTL